MSSSFPASILVRSEAENESEYFNNKISRINSIGKALWRHGIRLASYIETASASGTADGGTSSDFERDGGTFAQIGLPRMVTGVGKFGLPLLTSRTAARGQTGDRGGVPSLSCPDSLMNLHKCGGSRFVKEKHELAAPRNLRQGIPPSSEHACPNRSPSRTYRFSRGEHRESPASLF